MPNRIALAAAMVLAVAGLAACSESEANHPNEASVTINGNATTKHSVRCAQQANSVPGQDAQWYWTIYVGDQKVAGAKLVVDGSGEKPVATSVRIQNLGGFIGMYSKDDGGEANTTFSSDTFTVTGKALGYNTSEAGEPAEATFKVIATC